MATAAVIQPSEQAGQVTQTGDLDGGHIIEMQMINLTLEVDDLTLKPCQFSNQGICDQRAMRQAQLFYEFLRSFMQEVNRQSTMCIVWHDQTVLYPEYPVVRNFKHPVATTEDAHCFQVTAQGCFVFLLVFFLGARSEIGINQCAVQTGNMLMLQITERLIIVSNDGDTGIVRRRHGFLLGGWLVNPRHFA